MRTSREAQPAGVGSRLTPWFVLAPVIAVCGCLTLTPEGARVKVASASLDVPLAKREMPDGCSRVPTSLKNEWMSEQEIEGQADPFRRQRNAVGAAGSNVLLVLKRMDRGRRGIECPSGSKITDCAGQSGAWFTIEFEGYACTPEALLALTAPKKTP